MAKKKRKSKEKSTHLLPKKLRKRLKTLVILGLVAAAIYFYTHPEAVGDPAKQELIYGLHDQVDQLSQKATEVGGNVLGEATGEVGKLVNTNLGEDIITQVDSPDDIEVEDLVKNFSEEMKKIPASQVKRVKYLICEDVLREATQSAD